MASVHLPENLDNLHPSRPMDWENLFCLLIRRFTHGQYSLTLSSPSGLWGPVDDDDFGHVLDLGSFYFKGYSFTRIFISKTFCCRHAYRGGIPFIFIISSFLELYSNHSFLLKCCHINREFFLHFSNLISNYHFRFSQ